MDSAAAPVRHGDPRRWKALVVCLVAAFMTLLDVSIVNVALPSIRAGLDASEGELQWIVSGYALLFGLVLVPAGRVGDARSRRTLFMAGLVLFVAASAMAGLAQSIWLLILARFVQGAAGGVINPQIAGLIQQLFRGAERGKAFGLLGATIGLATAAGPILGGVLIQLGGPEEGWRWVFYVNIPVGLLAVFLARRLLPAGGGGRQESLDPVGVVLLGTGVIALLLPFAQERQWEGPAKWLLLPFAAATLTLFVVWELRHGRHAAPLVDLSLFRRRSYTLGAGLILLYFAGFTAIFFIYTLFLQSGLGYSPLQAGLAITPFALGSGAAAMAGGRVVHRYGRALVTAGLVLVLAGLLATLLSVRLAAGHQVALFTTLPLLLTGVGSGLVISPNQTITLSEVPPSGGGSAAGMLQTGQRMGTAVGIAAVSSLFFATVAETSGDWALAFEHGLLLVGAFVLAALALAVFDLSSSR
ncbi:MFS transporter [Streptosporangium sp. KLBMP 9127]|nr:MFS transporter [Streptosporangium sp. KLBMP 9127]